MRSIGSISSHSKILNTLEANFILKIEQWVILDCGYIFLGQPVDGSHCCEDGLRLCFKNTALCVAERIPHSFFINSILMFFTVFIYVQSWGSKICTPFYRCKGVCLLRFPTKIAEHFRCDMLKIARCVHHAWLSMRRTCSVERDWNVTSEKNFKRAIKYTFHVLF